MSAFPCARGEGASRRKFGERWGPGGHSVSPSSRGASGLPRRGRCAEAARGFPLEVGEGARRRLHCPLGKGGAVLCGPRVGAQEGLAPSRWVWGSASGGGGRPGRGRGPGPTRGPGRPLAARAATAARRVGLCGAPTAALRCLFPRCGHGLTWRNSDSRHSQPYLACRIFPKKGDILSLRLPSGPLLKKLGFSH